MAWYSMTEHNQMLDMHTLGPTPPVTFFLILILTSQPYLHLTDGGHLDNLGLIQLMKRKCKKIIIFDAGSDKKVIHGNSSMTIDFL